jgi:hypothetical protein
VSRATRRFEGDPDFNQRVLPVLVAQPFFRRATEDELSRSYEAYCGGSPAQLIEVWRAAAEPVRAELGPIFSRLFRGLGLLPKRINGLSFLATLRAVLAAGVRFRATLRPETQTALRTEFPWLERRHEHVPPGPAPHIDFPATFGQFIDGGDLDDARARWQLAAALNEVQQTVLSDRLAELYGLDELHLHAAREREMALSYFGHWSPEVDERLWQQCIFHLDALNARVFATTCSREGPRLLWRAALTRAPEWEAFVDGLARSDF